MHPQYCKSNYISNMKKPIALFALLCTLCMGAHANLIFHETFDYAAGQLSAGKASACNDSTKWWTISGSSNYVNVVEGSLSYPGYVTTATGNKAQLNKISGTKEARRFVPITSGSVYAAAIINMTEATTSTDHFFGLCDGSSSYYSRVYAKSVDGGFQLAIAKYTELKTDLTYSSTLSYNTNYLVVVEYVFKEGTKNDSVNLWINPTMSTTTPTIACNKTLADAKGDVSKIAGVYIYQNTNAPTVAIDEIKVATTWDDLFESGSTPTPDPATTPTIDADTKISFNEDFPYTGETYTATFGVYASDLTDDVTLSCDNPDVALSQTTIAKEDVQADIVTITATLLTNTAGEGNATITISSTGAKDVKVTSSWYALALTKCATVAEMNTAAATASGYDYAYIRFTGEAVVTYTFYQSGNKYYLQDATGAIQVNDIYWTISRGDKLTNFDVYAYADDLSSGILPVNTLDNKVNIVSRGNEWTPEVVTLTNLQAAPANYLLHLIKVEDVTFADNTAFASGVTATQDDKTITINLLTGNDLIGAAKPSKADITGISTNASGQVLRVRDKNDVKEITEGGDPTAIETITLNQLSGYYEIYNLAGQRLNALQQGVNIIRQGNNTYKVIR